MVIRGLRKDSTVSTMLPKISMTLDQSESSEILSMAGKIAERPEVLEELWEGSGILRKVRVSRMRFMMSLQSSSRTSFIMTTVFISATLPSKNSVISLKMLVMSCTPLMEPNGKVASKIDFLLRLIITKLTSFTKHSGNLNTLRKVED